MQQVDAGNSAPSDRWFVTNGVVAVGPVTFELVLRGVSGIDLLHEKSYPVALKVTRTHRVG
jgi:hypothetical protein